MNRAAESNTHSAAGLRRRVPDVSDRTGIIFDIKRYAIHDGPGIRTTVFFKGCPLRCRWCQNPESWDADCEHSLRTSLCADCGRCVEACDQGAIARSGDRLTTDPTRCVFCGACVDACPTGAREILGRRVTVAQVMAEIQRDVIFYDGSGGGATFSGGEPLMQAEFLDRLLRECKAREIHTALDTSCCGPWEVLRRIHDAVDLYLCDLKHMDAAVHERLTGVSNERILENLRRLAGLDRPMIIRIPVIPGANDDEENVVRSAEFVASLDRVRQIDILPYNELVRGKVARLVQTYELPDVKPPPPERIEAIRRTLEDFGFAVKIGG